MHWFQGSIAEAVAKSKSLNAVFIVFVEGSDEMSRDLAGVLEVSEVAARLRDQNKFLAVRLSSTDQNYTHFAQIYKFVPVPSVFFIGRDGSPLEVVCAGITADKMVQRIDRILELHYNKTSNAEQTSLAPNVQSSSTSAAASASLIHAESASTHTSAGPRIQEAGDASSTKPAPKDDGEYEIVCDGDVCTRRPKTSTEQIAESALSSTSAVPVAMPTAPTAVNTAPAAVNTAPAAVNTAPAAVNAAPTALNTAPTAVNAAPTALNTAPTEVASAGASLPAASEAEAADAVARVKRAQELIEARRREKEAKEREEEKRRELERRATGQGVAELKRWQHERELKEAAEERRRERQANEEARQRVLQQIAQDRAERQARQAPSPPPFTTTITTTTTVSTPTPASSASVARLQLKMADGNSHVATFAPDDTMADVYAYVREHGLASSASYTLWTAFPRRALSPDDATLSSLGLSPSAALLLLNADEASAVSAPATNIYGFITTLLSALIVRPVMAVWSWISERVFPPPAPRPATPPAAAARPAAAEGLRYRGGSNVRRLRQDDDDEDDNNTWNGNSTQQM